MTRFPLRPGAVVAWAAIASIAFAAEPDETIHPFSIKVEQEVLDDLQSRLARTRWPQAIEGSGWEYGVDLEYMQELVEYWRTEYDWRAQERMLNQYDQFVSDIDGLDLHFIHVRSPHEDALPLVIIHGWPGSFVEFTKIIGPLTNPEDYGGSAEDAFHVVCPSLPGFGFSEKPNEPGWSVNRMSEPIAKLMQRLGYDRYGAQGGDWGSSVARWLGQYDSEHVVGVHVNFIGAGPPDPDNPYAGVTEEEKERMQRRREELQKHKAYSPIQGTRPQTLGYALVDSPVGQAAWIVDKFWAWSDHGGDLENSFTKDELLNNVMIYWITETGPSSARIYFERESYNAGRSAGDVPLGYVQFPKELNVFPRKWVVEQHHLAHYTDMPRGGHFAAMEEPELLTRDIREFFSQVRD